MSADSIKTSMRDSLYSKPVDSIEGFTFDEKVAAVFPDMIKRSVPGYATVIAMRGVLAGQYVQPGSKCYDMIRRQWFHA